MVECFSVLYLTSRNTFIFRSIQDTTASYSRTIAPRSNWGRPHVIPPEMITTIISLNIVLVLAVASTGSVREMTKLNIEKL